MKKIILLLLLCSNCFAQFEPFDWFEKPDYVLLTVSPIDTAYPTMAYDTNGYAVFGSDTSLFYVRSNDAMVRPLEMNWSTTSTLTIEFWIMQKRNDLYFLAGKNSTTTTGWYIKHDHEAVGAKDLSIRFIGSTYKPICYLNDTINWHHIKIVYTKSDSTLKMYHGGIGTPDTNTFTYTAVTWNSNFHVDVSFCIGGWTLFNPDCSGDQVMSNIDLRFKGRLKTMYITVNDTAYTWDFRRKFLNIVYNNSSLYKYDRPGYDGSLWNGNTWSLSRTDNEHSGAVRLYPLIFDTTIFRHGIQGQYTQPTNLCTSYGISLDTATYQGYNTVIWGGSGNCANSNQWNASLYDKISPSIAYWDILAQKWWRIGYGFNGQIVVGIGHRNRTLYATGDFVRTYADTTYTTLGDTMNYIAQFDLDTGTTWRQMGSGLNNQGTCVLVYNDTVIIGGGFTTAGGAGANYIVKWNGTSYNTLGTGCNGAVWALAQWNGNLVVAGDFTDKGTRIALWNGTAWSNPFGAGANSTIYTLHVTNDNILVAGGVFTSIGGITTTGLAWTWDGATWYGIGTGVSGFTVQGNGLTAITSYRNILFFGGTFLYANGERLNNMGAYNLITGEVTPLGYGAEMRVESVINWTNPLNNEKMIVWNGDFYLLDEFPFATVGGFKLSTIIQ